MELPSNAKLSFQSISSQDNNRLRWSTSLRCCWKGQPRHFANPFSWSKNSPWFHSIICLCAFNCFISFSILQICSVGTPCLMSNAGQTRRYLTFPTTVLTATTSCTKSLKQETRVLIHKIKWPSLTIASSTSSTTTTLPTPRLLSDCWMRRWNPRWRPPYT